MYWLFLDPDDLPNPNFQTLSTKGKKTSHMSLINSNEPDAADGWYKSVAKTADLKGQLKLG